MTKYYIGLLSGTSVDEIDAAIFELKDEAYISTIYTHSHPIPLELKEETLNLSQTGATTLKQIGELDVKWGALFAQSVEHLLSKAKLKAEDIIAIGSHGQTIWHQPTGPFAFTLQIGNPHIIAEKTKIKTVSDFRRRDMAQGGQGAPLAPKFHQHYFQTPDKNRILVNLGGITNISYLPKDVTNPIIGFDTGPANSLLDAWCKLKQNQAYDKSGEWARSGQIQPTLLTQLLDDAYFKMPYPKSTGKDYFNLQWLLNKKDLHTLMAQDVQATLIELTALTLKESIKELNLAQNEEVHVLLCGGGAHNIYLKERISSHLGQNFKVQTTQILGLSPDWVEAALFAWLAKSKIENLALDYTSITGASKPAVLGVCY